MDDRHAGLAIRALRRGRAWRQDDVAEAAGVSQSMVSLIERGHIQSVSLATLRRVAGALEARCSVDISWRGAALDRLVDERHSALVEAVVRLLRTGWEIAAEVTFAHFGERGSVDVLAWHAATRTLLIVEVKTELASIEETLRRLDIKVRLGPDIARPRAWRPSVIARLLVIGDSGAARRAVASREATFQASYPRRGWEVRRWLAAPSGSLAGILFLPLTRSRSDRRSGGGSHRVRSAPGGPNAASQRPPR